MVLMEPKANCTKCIAELDRKTLIRIGDWVLCNDCYGDTCGKAV